MKTLLRDRVGSTVGYILDSPNGVKQVFTPEGKRLGQYNPATDTTVNENGVTIGFGDFTAALAMKAKNK